MVVCATLLPFSIYTVNATASGVIVSIPVVIALFVCLAPTTIGSLLSAIGIAGMDRMVRANIVVLSPKVVESAGDIDTLILDKTGTITLGNRQATEFIPAIGISTQELADAAQLSSLADETPEGRSIVILAKTKYGLRGRTISDLHATFIPFTAQSRMSGANMPGRQIRKGAGSAIEAYVKQHGGVFPADVQQSVDSISRKGGTALVVAEQARVMGVIHLKDVVKGGIKERFAQLRKMGIKTIMVTGDNQLTSAAIAAEAGVDDFLADALPADKLELIRRLQAEGHLVAMAGDGSNDAPALAQADIAMTMNSGTQAAKEAGNLVDLDSNPTKLIEVVEIGKQLLMTRGALTTFSIASDISKNFTILPAALAGTYPTLQALNIMHLATKESAIISTVIFNALIILCMIPLALRGVRYRKVSAAELLLDNVLIYGLGGLILPFIGIKLIDMVIAATGLM
jgi:K+-transporting ATPase ATPase B chain